MLTTSRAPLDEPPARAATRPSPFARPIPRPRPSRGRRGRASAVIALLPVLLLTILAPVPAAAAATATPMIVLLERTANVDRALDRATDAIGRTPGRAFRSAVRGYAADLTPAQVTRLRRDPAVEAIVPDSVVRLTQLVPAGIRRVGATLSPATRIDGRDGATGTERVDADIAIIDTGIQPDHPDLDVRGGVNCTGEGSAGAWGDGNGHGTHVAGIAAAKDNAIGVVGTAPGARLWAVRVFRPDGFSRISWIVCGIDWITSRRDPNDPSRPLIEVASMSLRDEGGDDGNCGYAVPDPEHRAICASVAAGITYVVSSGNDRTTASRWRPASYDEVITVSAIADYDGRAGGHGTATCRSFGEYDRDDTFANFANRGADVDITAPGVCIRSTYRNSTYATISGTSMSTPAVAGAAAVYRALHPGADPAEVRLALRAMGSYDWATSTDPDRIPDPLLDMRSLGRDPDFTLVPRQTTLRTWAGGSAVLLDLRVTRGNGFDATIELDALDLPAGVSAGWTDDRLGGLAETTSRLTLTANASAPAGTHAVRIRGRGDGITRERFIALTIQVDTTPPAIGVPRPAVLTGQTVGGSVRVRVSWPTSDAGIGLESIGVEERAGEADWVDLSLPARAQSADRQLAFGTPYDYRVAAGDLAGNDATRTGTDLRPLARSEGVARYAGLWRISRTSGSWGGSTRYATAPGASATYTFTGRSIGWVASMGPTRGRARVYVDGVFIRLVDLRSSSPKGRQVVFSRSWATSGRHTIRIVVEGTSGRPRIDIDGFVVVS